MIAFATRFARNRTAAAALVFVLLLVWLAIMAPTLFPGDPLRIAGKAGIWPFTDPAHPLGTDQLGRDILAGIVHGARPSLLIGLTASIASSLLGVTVGAIAGYYEGRAGDLLMRLTEIFQTIPNVMLALIIVTIAGPSIWSVIAAIACVTWPASARMARMEFMRLKNADFVQACVGLGMRDRRIIFSEILPNALAPLIVLASLAVALSILVESSLSFLGLGDPNRITWGMMVGNGRAVLRTQWYVAALPGAAILLAVLAISLVGEGLNDLLNPKLRRR